MITFAASDWIFIGIYLVLLITITAWHTRSKNSTAEFLLAGRRLTLPVFVGTLVSTWYGGIFGISEMVGLYGLGAWLIQGIFWYFIYLIFALFLAKRIREQEFYTIPDILENRFGKKAAFIGGIFTYIMVNPAPYMLSLGFIIQYITGISFLTAVIIAMVLSVIYTWLAGFRGVVYTDFFQFIWMFTAFFILLYCVVDQWGGVAFFDHLENKQHLTITGGMDWGYILVWAGLACWVFVDPNFYQRCSAVESPEVAQKGIFICIVFWFLFDICTIATALYAYSAKSAGIIDFEQGKAYLAVAEHILDSPFKGLFMAGILSTVMSTTDSFLFVAAVNLSRDYYWRFINRNASDEQMVVATRIGILITAILAVCLVMLFPSVKDLWFNLGTIGVCGLLVPMIHSFWGKSLSEKAAIASMLMGSGVAVIWLISGYWHMVQSQKDYPIYFLSLQPLYPGLLVGIGVYSIVHITTKKKVD